MEKAKIERINALAAKAKTQEGLTEAEMLEQKALREEYIRDFRASMRGILNNTTIVSPDGSKEYLAGRAKKND